MGIFERYMSAGPKWQIIFGLLLVLAGAFAAISAEISPEHLYSKEIDQVIGIVVVIIGSMYSLLWYDLLEKGLSR